MGDIWRVYLSETVIVPALKSVARKRLVENVIVCVDTSLCVSVICKVYSLVVSV
jgi:hypothetical protein